MADACRASAPTSLPVTHCSFAGLAGPGTQWLADPITVSQLYAAMTATQHPQSPIAGMDPGLCEATYLIGLAKANALQEQSVAPKTLKTRHQHVRELADWLQSTRTLQTCLPEDVLVFFTTAWLPAHAGSATATGQKIAAPSSLSRIRSSLSAELEQLGRTGGTQALFKVIQCSATS